MIPLFKVNVPPSANTDTSLLGVLHSGYIGQGKKVEEFEAGLGDFLQARHILTTNCCTSALVLALRLAGVKYGDEVISCPMTCLATTSAIIQVGGVIKWADVKEWTGLIDYKDVKEKITDKTKAIVVVCWGGEPPPDLDKFQDFGIPIIIDAAQALGATFMGHPIHQFADFTCYSFGPIKHLTTGDGGAVVCSDSDYTKGRLLRWYGLDRTQSEAFRCQQDVVEIGYKFHMNDIAATIGLAGIPHIKQIIEHHRSNHIFYRNALSAHGKHCSGQVEAVGTSAWLFTMFVDEPERFKVFMAEGGVAVGQPHRRNDQNTYAEMFRVDLPNLDYFQKHYVCIPVGWWVSLGDRQKIVEYLYEYEIAGELL